jgi:glycosyltransferase involved in cell wall biosynthesis
VSVAAVMMVRDEADVLPGTLDWLRTQVDEIYVLDNRSVDGSREIAEAAGAVVRDDPEVGYFQSRKTSLLAREAYDAGHAWVVPVDADEIWAAPEGRTLSAWLGSQGPDVLVARAVLLNYVPTSLDDPGEPNPLRRLRWRFVEPGALPKVACRAKRSLTIHAGNHGADYGSPRRPFGIDGLTVRHFSWRTEAQYVRKIRNGIEAYAATDLPETTGAHWRAWDGATDDEIGAHFREWFYVDDPYARNDLVYDPLDAL